MILLKALMLQLGFAAGGLRSAHMIYEENCSLRSESLTERHLTSKEINHNVTICATELKRNTIPYRGASAEVTIDDIRQVDIDTDFRTSIEILNKVQADFGIDRNPSDGKPNFHLSERDFNINQIVTKFDDTEVNYVGNKWQLVKRNVENENHIIPLYIGVAIADPDPHGPTFGTLRSVRGPVDPEGITLDLRVVRNYGQQTPRVWQNPSFGEGDVSPFLKGYPIFRECVPTHTVSVALSATLTARMPNLQRNLIQAVDLTTAHSCLDEVTVYNDHSDLKFFRNLASNISNVLKLSAARPVNAPPLISLFGRSRVGDPMGLSTAQLNLYMDSRNQGKKKVEATLDLDIKFMHTVAPVMRILLCIFCTMIGVGAYYTPQAARKVIKVTRRVLQGEPDLSCRDQVLRNRARRLSSI